MPRSRLHIAIFIGLATCLTSAALGASHRDWTVVPLGSFELDRGQQTLHILRPYDRFGVIPSPVTLTAVLDPSAVKLPLTLELACGDTMLPAWNVRNVGETYVIGLNALDRLTENRDGRATLLLTVVTDASAKGALLVSGPPDMRLCGESWVGPLADCVERMERGWAREYLAGVAACSETDLRQAKAVFKRLAGGSEALIARHARDKLRRIAFAELEARAPQSFETCRRLGLYAQQCGLTRHAMRQFNNAANLLPREPSYVAGDTLYRLGETMERCGYPPERFAPLMQTAGEAAGVTPNVWDICVAILMKERYEEEIDGRKVTKVAAMTPEQVEKIKREWGWVTQMVYGASGGHFLLNTHFVEVPNDVDTPYETFGGWLRGPTDAFVPVRGTYDGVMSFRPRGPSVTGGADCGPNGAAMVDIGTWCGWEVYLHEWNHSFDWTRNTGEIGDGYPITHHSDGCGHQPIASMGYGHRSSMRYWVTPAMYHRMEAADPDTGEGYIDYWWAGERQRIEKKPPANENELPAHHVLDYDWRSVNAVYDFLTAGSDGFVDLNAFYADDSKMKPGTWCVTHARTSIWSPKRQEVRLWLGHNDGMAVWVNDELMHRGDYYAIAKFEDKNWPNMAAAFAVLQEGWNDIDVVVESWPAPRDKGYGFSVRVCDADNHPVPGLKFAEGATALPKEAPTDPLRPTFGRYYKWDEVRDDYYRKLPRISEADLRAYFALPSSEKVTVKSEVGATTGYLAISATTDERSDSLLPMPAAWDHKRDADARLNNVMDYNREAIAVYPFHRQGTDRHLLIMRPEAIDAYLTCLREEPSAARVYADRPIAERMLGYFQTGTPLSDGDAARVWMVAEAILPTPLPFDEEDLLSPLP